MDLARVGQTVLDGGAGVVPAGWMAAALTGRASIDGEIDYGYQWYLSNGSTGGPKWVAAFGNGGQRIIVVPSLGLVVSITCGNYNRADQGLVPRRVLREFVLGALAR